MTAFFGFGATPPRHHVSLFARARSPLVPLCVAPCVCAIAPGGRPFRCPGDVGPEGRLPFVGRIFRACAKPGTGPVLRHLRHVPQHTMPGSGRAPGLPAGPGSFFGHCGKIWVFPSFGNSFGVPHPGTLPILCNAVAMHLDCIERLGTITPPPHLQSRQGGKTMGIDTIAEIR